MNTRQSTAINIYIIYVLDIYTDVDVQIASSHLVTQVSVDKARFRETVACSLADKQMNARQPTSIYIY